MHSMNKLEYLKKRKSIPSKHQSSINFSNSNESEESCFSENEIRSSYNCNRLKNTTNESKNQEETRKISENQVQEKLFEKRVSNSDYKRNRFSSIYKIKYKFSTERSRKRSRDKKHKIKKSKSRIFKMDSMLKKIKSKYLKYLHIELKDKIPFLNQKNFDQVETVRNLNIYDNRDEFLNLTILEFLINNGILGFNDSFEFLKTKEDNFIKLIHTKIKFHFHFDFLKSDFFLNWINDPSNIKKPNNDFIKGSKGYSKSKNLFLRREENYQFYKLLLLQSSSNFVFYFQNNSLKYGKHFKKYDD